MERERRAQRQASARSEDLARVRQLTMQLFCDVSLHFFAALVRAFYVASPMSASLILVSFVSPLGLEGRERGGAVLRQGWVLLAMETHFSLRNFSLKRIGSGIGIPLSPRCYLTV